MSTEIQVGKSALEEAVAAAQELPSTEKSTGAAANDDSELLGILSKTQNDCLAELGYHPTLLQEFEHYKQRCKVFQADNEKLYSDNRSLAQFIQALQQRMDILLAPADQQKRALAGMHDTVRALMLERDEVVSRLNMTLHDNTVLRQQLAWYRSNAIRSASQRTMPGSTSHPQPPLTGQQKSMHQPVVVSQSVGPGNSLAVPASSWPPPVRTQPIQPISVRQGQPPPHRGSLPTLYPIDTSAPPAHTLKQQHRRPSAPTPLTAPLTGFGPSPVSASPIGHFSDLSLGSAPTTPVGSRPSSRPGTANSAMAPPPMPASRPSSRGLHVPAPVTMQMSSSSLAGAVVDVPNGPHTNDSDHEDTARKRRKLDHTPQVASPPPRPPKSASPPQAPQAAPTLLQAPSRTSVSEPVSQTAQPPAAMARASSHQQHPLIVQPAPTQLTTYQPAKDNDPPEDHDHVMIDSVSELERTIEEEAVDTTFEEDDEDRSKRWCIMCKFRYKNGRPGECPMPFVGASHGQLVEHCLVVHPKGWEILKEQLRTTIKSEM